MKNVNLKKWAEKAKQSKVEEVADPEDDLPVEDAEEDDEDEDENEDEDGESSSAEPPAKVLKKSNLKAFVKGARGRK